MASRMARVARVARVLALVLALGWAVPGSAAAQGGVREEGLSRAFELERLGDYAGAAGAYRAVLAERPAELGALLGLERVLLPLNRSADILPQIRNALAAEPKGTAIHGLALRAWAAADQPDSMRAAAERWAAAAPGDETPFREWGAAALGRRDRAGARAAYTEGRARLGRPDALSAELAQLAGADGNYVAALQEWLSAMRRFPGYRAQAAATLAAAPDSARAALLAAVGGESDPAARALEAELRARWGDPVAGFEALARALPADRVRAVEALRAFLDGIRSIRSRESRLAQGRTLEALASRSANGQGARLRLEAAEAYSGAGEWAAAGRLLDGLADEGDTSAAVSADAASTLIGALVGEGRVANAAGRLQALRPTLTSEQYAALNRRVVLGWIRSGDLVRADRAIAVDSSVEGLALSGRIRLYQGDLAEAVRRLEAAGPFAGEREEATRRTATLSLLQQIEVDSLPALGDALLRLERGDTLGAVSGLEAVAAGLPPEGGGAEIRLLAGRAAAAAHRDRDAERLLRAAADTAAVGTAPAAELALAELLLQRGRAREAASALEHLILTYPESALVPQARRRLDEARGAVPRT